MDQVVVLACELQLVGISVVVLERMEDPHSPRVARWTAMHAASILRSVEPLDRRARPEEWRRANAFGWMNGRVEPRPGTPGAQACGLTHRRHRGIMLERHED